MALLGLQAERCVEQPVETAGDTDRHQHLLGLDHLGLLRGLVLDGDLRAASDEPDVGTGCRLLDGLRHAAELEFDPLLLEDLERFLRDVVILHRHDAVEHLDHGHLGAERVVEVGELHADRARADDHHRLRPLRQDHRLVAADDCVAVLRRERQLARRGAGGDEHLVGGDHHVVLADGTGALVVVLVGLRHLHLARAAGGLACQDLGVALDVLDFVLLEEEPDAAVERAGHVARATDHLGPVELHVLRVHLKAHVRTVLEGLGVDAGRMEQRLGRDAAPVQADAAELGALDAGNLLAELRRADRADVAAGSAADHDEVIMLCVCHGSVPRVGKCR